jgi:hypothetical protein
MEIPDFLNLLFPILQSSALEFHSISVPFWFQHVILLTQGVGRIFWTWENMHPYRS